MAPAEIPMTFAEFETRRAHPSDADDIVDDWEEG
jgi:hypothetical protein